MTRGRHRVTIRILLAAAILPAVSAKGAEESKFLRLWEEHVQSPGEHDAVIAACRAFTDAHPSDPLVPVAHGIAAWHFLKQSNTDEAARILQAYASPQEGTVKKGAQLVAHGWLTRIDRERVADSLQDYYRKEVAYPKSLKAVAAHPKIAKTIHPPTADRFGKAWSYKLTGFEKLPGFDDQRYQLESTTLGASSDLADALKPAYGTGLRFKPVEVRDWSPPLVKFTAGGVASSVALGQKAGDVYLAYVGKKILVVCNHSYWKIVPRS